MAESENGPGPRTLAGGGDCGEELFPMYKLTVDGLNQAMVKLMANK